MQLWKTILTYDGTPFHGWQVQPGLPTVQGTLAQALHRITGESVLPQGSGRTDTGVHALGQVASFSLAAPIPAENLQRALNRTLPSSIRVLSIEAMDSEFHARHSARGKTYEYRIFPSHRAHSIDAASGLEISPAPRICSPMLAPFVWDCPLPLDLKRMQAAACAVVGTYDFTSFAAADPDLTTRDEEDEPVRSAVRTIRSSTWLQSDELFIYRVNGTGFLHHMVRNLVGTFVDIGTGRLSPAAIPQIIAARARSAAGPTAPARGLFLVEVEY